MVIHTHKNKQNKTKKQLANAKYNLPNGEKKLFYLSSKYVVVMVTFNICSNQISPWIYNRSTHILSK